MTSVGHQERTEVVSEEALGAEEDVVTSEAEEEEISEDVDGVISEEAEEGKSL